MSAAMTRPCLRDAGTYDFRTKWFLIFFKKIAIPSFSAVLPLCRPAARRLAARCLVACRPLPCHLAVLPPCRPATLPPCRPPSCRSLPCHLAARRPVTLPPAALPTATRHPAVRPTRPNGACRFLALPSVRGKSACGETPFLHDLTRAATKKRPRRGSFSLCRVSAQPQI